MAACARTRMPQHEGLGHQLKQLVWAIRLPTVPLAGADALHSCWPTGLWARLRAPGLRLARAKKAQAPHPLVPPMDCALTHALLSPSYASGRRNCSLCSQGGEGRASQWPPPSWGDPRGRRRRRQWRLERRRRRRRWSALFSHIPCPGDPGATLFACVRAQWRLCLAGAGLLGLSCAHGVMWGGERWRSMTGAAAPCLHPSSQLACL